MNSDIHVDAQAALPTSNIAHEALEEKIETVGSIIIAHHMERCMRTFDFPVMQEYDRTDQMLQCVYLWCNWLERRKGVAEDLLALAHQIRQTLQSQFTKEDQYIGEQCIICEANTELLHLTKGGCHNGHTFGRCCQTLLLCHEVPYRTCTFCGEFAVRKVPGGHPWLQLVLQETCTYCDGTLV